jgi:hypothetical protein
VAVDALVVSDSTVCVGGNFTEIGGAQRTNIAALDAYTGAATDWQPGASSPVRVLAVSGSTVYAGGYFASVGGYHRMNVAALDARTGTPTSWNASANGPVSAMAMSGSRIYAAGAFTRIGGRARTYLASLRQSTGAATAWNPHVNGRVDTLAVSGADIYAGGSFTRVGRLARNHIAKLDLRSGKATAWNPGANDDVHALALSRSRVYAGGVFTRIGGRARRLVAALDAATGRVTAWNPGPTCNDLTEWGERVCDYAGESIQHYTDIVDVAALLVTGSPVYVGGTFEEIGGKTRTNIAAIDAHTGKATAWRPAINLSYSPVRALAEGGSTIYLGSTRSTGAFSTRSGKRTWSPTGDIHASALALTNSRLYLGGVWSYVWSGYAVFGPGAAL